MYNKLFTKILDSSIWLEPDATRLVWLTLIAAMDEDGFAQFASPANLAHRAIVQLEACEKAITTLESPDHNSSDKENEGKRIERVPGGWMILNSEKYKDLVTRAVSKERTRERVAKWRSKNVTPCNNLLRNANGSVTQSDTDTASDTDTKKEEGFDIPLNLQNEQFKTKWNEWIQHRKEKRNKVSPSTGQKQLRTLSGWGTEKACKSIDTAIEKGWVGFFEPKENMFKPKFEPRNPHI